MSFDIRGEVSVKFPVVSGQPPNRPDGYCEIENKMKEMILRQEKILDEIQRVRQIMDRENENFHRKKQEFLKFLADSSAYTYQVICNQLVFNVEEHKCLLHSVYILLVLDQSY